MWPSGMHDAADPPRGCGEVWCTREGATNHLAHAHPYNLHARQGWSFWNCNKYPFQWLILNWNIIWENMKQWYQWQRHFTCLQRILIWSFSRKMKICYINRYLLKGCFLPIVQCPPMAPVALEKLEPARGSRVWCSWGERSSGAVPRHCLRKNVTPGLRCVVTPWR